MNNQPNDPRDMRKAITKVMHSYERMDGQDETPLRLSTVAALVKNVHYASAHAGYSGEDEMTMLAYHALLALEQATDRLLDMVNCTVSPMIIPKVKP